MPSDFFAGVPAELSDSVKEVEEAIKQPPVGGDPLYVRSLNLILPPGTNGTMWQLTNGSIQGAGVKYEGAGQAVSAGIGGFTGFSITVHATESSGTVKLKLTHPTVELDLFSGDKLVAVYEGQGKSTLTGPIKGTWSRRSEGDE
ncbi:hypothetical protein IEO21_05534 [Rhodonia placenta]|uniref:Uncharacterized protein n=1 Tax=Rhodonia placenta TaxID=104341 RepID=A0A8H7U1G4_9APHY|nr:hypothetical protein IEO21_05534 [Postia placenta]